MIYRAAKLLKISQCCKRLQWKNVKKKFLYVIQHKSGMYACAREKLFVLLWAILGLECFWD